MDYTFTPEEFFEKTKQYHAMKENKNGKFPDLAGLLNFTNLTNEEYQAMLEDPVFAEPIRWATRRRESYLVNELLVNKNATGIKMLLQQPENGGYTDKPVNNTPRTVKILLKGTDDDE